MASDIVYLTQQLNSQRADIEKYTQFYSGKTKIRFMGTKLQETYGAFLETLSVNRCGIVADAITNKLKIRGWEDEDAESDADEEAFETWRNIESEADQVHHDVIVTGNGWLLGWPDENNKLIVAAQDPAQIAVRFNAEDPEQIDVAAKTWQRADGSWRLNLYYVDRLEKYQTNSPQSQPPDSQAAWERFSDRGDLAWPVEHNLKRVPLWHFKTNGRKGQLGVSHLAPIIPLQERLNIDMAAQAVAVEHQAYAQRWATGIQVEYEEDGTTPKNPFIGAADSLFVAPGSDANFGAFPIADLEAFEMLLQGDEKRIAITARIPLHLVTGSGDLSGEALKTSEKAFIDMTEAAQMKLGLVWTDVMQTILYHTNGVLIDQLLKPRWVSAATRDESDYIKRIVSKVSLGISPQQALRELDYSGSQIQAFVTESEEWQRSKQRLVNEGLVA